MSLPPATRLGPYEVLAPLDSGEGGEIYRARDTRLGREVAVKIMREGAAYDAEARRRFRGEATVLCKLSHPNVVAVLDGGTEAETDFLVMELVPGASLAERLREGPIPVADVLSLSLQLAEGVAAAHEAGIVHGDLRPENIRVTPEGRLKVILATSTRVAGTAYTAPEVVSGARATTRSDVFALGVVMNEMATGGNLPEGLELVILDAMRREPAQRPATAGDLAASLRRLAGDVRPGAGSSPSGS